MTRRLSFLLGSSLLGSALLAGCGGAATPGSSSGPPSPPPPSLTGTTTGTPAGPTGNSSPGGAGPAGQKPVAAENNPPGDIPDNVAYVPYRNPAGRYSFTHPEGWAETTRGAMVTFTDKLNGVQVNPGTATAAPTKQTAQSTDVPELQRTQAAFELRSVDAASVPGGKGARIVYRRNSAPDPVTGRQYRDEVQRYELVSNGREVVVELFGPVGADNVDAYRTMIQSLRLA